MTDFLNNNRFLIGANYWQSKSSINMWHEWDAETARSEFEKLAANKIKPLRMFLL